MSSFYLAKPKPVFPKQDKRRASKTIQLDDHDTLVDSLQPGDLVLYYGRNARTRRFHPMRARLRAVMYSTYSECV